MASTLKEVMTDKPVCLPATTTLDEAARKMREEDIGDVMVMDADETLCGIVTDRDIVVRAVADGTSPKDVRLGDICTREVTTLPSDGKVEEAVRVMRDKAIRRIPVVDNGKPVGIVSIGDLALEQDRKSALADISAAPPNT